jgi:integrase
VHHFREQLFATGRSPYTVKRATSFLGSLIADAQQKGQVGHNVVRDLSRQNRGNERRQEQRRKGKLKVGEDIPTGEEIGALIAGATSQKWRAFLIVACFTGLRVSEIRGLRWCDVDLEKSELHVRQRADRFNQIGKPKSHGSERTVPLPMFVVNRLKEWKHASGQAGVRLQAGAS